MPPQPARRGGPRPHRRRLGDLHLGLHGHPQGRGGQPPQRRGRSSTPSRGCSCRTEPIGPGDRVMAGLSVAFDACCEEMWLAWAHGACLVPAPRSLVRSGVDVGPWLVANDITVVSTVPTLVALWPTESLDARAPADPGRRGLPARDRRPARHRRPRGLEHLRPDRGHRRRLRRPAAPARDRCASGCPLDGWDLAVVDAAGRAGPGRRAGRADHRRRRAGALPRPGQGRREVRRDADPGLGPRLPQRRPGAVRRRGAGLRRAGPTTRSSSAAGASSSARSTARCSALPGRGRRGRRRAPQPGGQPACWSATSRPTTASTRPPRSSGCAGTMPAALVPRLAAVDALPDPHLRQDRPRRPAVAAPGRRAPRHRRAGPVGAPRPGWRTSGSTCSAPSSAARRRLLRPRRRQPHRRADGVPAARALPRGHRRRPLRAPRPSATLAAALDDMATPAGRRRPPRCARRPSKTQVGQVVAHRARSDRSPAALAHLGRRSAHNVRPRVLGLDWLPPSSLGLGARSAGCCWSSRPAGWLLGAVGARVAAARRRARRLPARRPRCTCGCGSPSGSPTSSARPTWRRRRPDAGLRPRCSAPRSASDVDLHSHAAGHRPAHAGQGLLRRARGRPDRPLARRRTCCTSAGSGSAPAPGSAPAARSAPAPTSARAPRSRPGSAVLGAVAARRVLVGRPGRRLRRARGPWSADRPPEPRRAGLAAYAAVGAGALAAAAPRGAGRARRGRAARCGGDRLADAALRGAAGCCRSRPWSALSCWPLLVLAVVRLLGRRARARAPPGAQPARRWQAWATLRVLDEARTWLFPLYASTLTPLWLRAARRRRSARTSRPRRCC